MAKILFNRLIATAALAAIVAVCAIPVPALAFKDQLDLLIPKTYELPSYAYTDTGVALALTSPVTKPSVAKTKPVILEGEASFYSRDGCLGCNPLRVMANGQPLNDNDLTMAIGANMKHLVGYRAKVTNLKTGQSTVVTITDTGGFYQAKYGHRVADLTIAAKMAIGMYGSIGQVRVEVLL